MNDFKLKIDGMSCGHCVKAVTSALEQSDGVKVRNVSIGSATGELDPSRTSPQQLVESLNAAGYTAAVVKEGA